jgi:hypothetical protein
VSWLIRKQQAPTTTGEKYQVGFFAPVPSRNNFSPSAFAWEIYEKDLSKQEAEAKVHFLNGGTNPNSLALRK